MCLEPIKQNRTMTEDELERIQSMVKVWIFFDM